MLVRQMAHPIPVLTGSEYRDRKTMAKDVRQKTTGKMRGTCGHVRTIYRCHEDTKVFGEAENQNKFTSPQSFSKCGKIRKMLKTCLFCSSYSTPIIL